jgi:hypothetical protein
MTINVHKTVRMERKLVCAKDNRTSAKVVGASIGMAVISIVGGLLFSGDIFGVFKRIFGIFCTPTT